MKSAQEILDGIIAYIRSSRFNPSSWYAGITQDPASRLFVEHNVDKENGRWIYIKASSSSKARTVEKALIDWGCDGGSGGGDVDAKYIYAYYKAASTIR